MQLWRTFSEVDIPVGGSSIALGVFDGMHRGHRALIDVAVGAGASAALTPVLVTFEPHPAAVVRPGAQPERLTTLAHRTELATELGVEAVFALPFDTEIASWGPEEFVDRIIVDLLRAGSVTVGTNFTFGHKAVGTPEMLRELCADRGIVCHIVDLMHRDGDIVSSSRIRGLLRSGDVADAAALLERPHRVSGSVVHGAGRGGRELGYPTANLEHAQMTAIPADGIYAGWFTITDTGDVGGSMEAGVRYPAAISVGTNPTFGDADRSVEAFVLDEDSDLYGRLVAVDFVDHVRPMVKFDSVEDLLDAMATDVERTRELLGLSAAGD